MGFLEILIPPIFYARNGRWFAAILSFLFWPFSALALLYSKSRDKDRYLFTGAEIGEKCPFCRNELNEGSTVCAHCHATYHVSGLRFYWILFSMGTLWLMLLFAYRNSYAFGLEVVIMWLLALAAIASPFLVSRKVSWRRFEHH